MAEAGGVDAVKAGGALTVIVRLGVRASGGTPLAARTVKVNPPAVVGVPDSTPAAVRLSPVGRVQEATLNVGAGFPVAVNV